MASPPATLTTYYRFRDRRACREAAADEQVANVKWQAAAARRAEAILAGAFAYLALARSLGASRITAGPAGSAAG